MRLTVTVAGRHSHARELSALTGLEVGEGQAQVLLADLRAYEATLREFHGGLPRRGSGGLSRGKAVELCQRDRRAQPTDSAAMVVVAEDETGSLRLPVPEELEEYPPRER